MPGTLLAYDADFPRANAPSGPIYNHPSEAELREHQYPAPYRLLPLRQGLAAEAYCDQIASAASAMRRLDRLILFGHGRVVQAATPSGPRPVTTGIIIGNEDITQYNAHYLSPIRRHMARGGMAELWVCDAAAAGEAGGQSGERLCTAIARALRVPVKAARETQRYTSGADQREIPGGGWQSTVRFLPWEGPLVFFRPNGTTRPVAEARGSTATP